MTDTTLDQARRCPTCNELGAPAGTRTLPREKFRPDPGNLHVFKCKNERCKRYDRDWVVQVRPDGTIPEPTLHRQKSFPANPGVSAKQRIERAQSNADRMGEAGELHFG